MKKILVFTAAILVSFIGFAQRNGRMHPTRMQHNGTGQYSTYARTTTHAGDTSMESNIAAGDHVVLYSAGADSGYLTGVNYWGDQSFAELYTGGDTSMVV